MPDDAGRRDAGNDGVLLVMGRTAAGKTALALALAETFDAEIVGADSRQIYRGMTIGTAAPTDGDRARVRHHLVGFLDPAQRYSAARFVSDALAAIDDIHARGKRAIVVGGTGFYLRALAGDITLSAVRDDALRARLEAETRLHPPDVLHDWLAALSPARAASVTPNDPYRIARALEIALTSRAELPLPGVSSVDSLRDDLEADTSPHDGLASEDSPSDLSLRFRGIAYRKLLVDVDDAALHPRIEARVDAMLDAGFLDEAERIGEDAVAADAVGYREALAFRAGLSTHAELRASLARNTRRYAKRQGTWFRREPDVDVIADAALSDGMSEEAAYRQAAAIAAELGWRARSTRPSFSGA